MLHLKNVAQNSVYCFYISTFLEIYGAQYVLWWKNNSQYSSIKINYLKYVTHIFLAVA